MNHLVHCAEFREILPRANSTFSLASVRSQDKKWQIQDELSNV